jgi:uncharacterized protein involved in exopolysaccharide biosynthesis/Mrp family chromosome partitioning ATPase
MLRKVENRHPDSAVIVDEPQSQTIDFETLLAAARRQLRLVLACVTGGLALGFVYLEAEVPLYMSTTEILIDKNQPPVVTALIETGTSMQLDPMMVSQVELLLSDRIGLKVVDSLGLATDQAFLSTSYSLLDSFKASVNGFVRSLIGSSAEGSPSTESAGSPGPDPRRRALGILARNLTADRVVGSYILTIGFWSPSAEMAQKIASKFAEIYISDQLGAKDESIVRARSALAEELEKVRKRSVDADLAVQKFRADNTLTDVRLVTKLRQLDLEASSLKSQYQQLLQNYQASLQNQTLELTDARVISEAALPVSPSFPSSALVLAIGVGLGGMIGTGLAIAREYRERSFRTSAQVRDELRLETLGEITLLHGKPMRRKKRDGDAESPLFIEVSNSAYNWVERNPRSEFAEAMRTVKAAVDIELEGKTTRTIGVVSCLPGEGKSLVSSNLAMMLAMQRRKTMLIDADMHNAGLSSMLASGWQHGLAETLAGDFNPRRDLLAHRSLPLRFLPGASHNQQTLTEPVQSLEGMVGFLLAVGSRFEYVVVDLPPIAVVADVRSFVHHLDAIVLVIEWGGTARQFVRESIDNNPILADKCVGVLLNKVDKRKLRKYQKFGSSEFYSERYQQYYHTK